MKRLVVIDPGLMELGGHHAAFVDSICNQLIDSKKQIECVFYSHNKIALPLEEKIRSAGGKVTKHFSINHYQIFGKDLCLKAEIEFVQKLASEYALALRDLKGLSVSRTALILYPSLSWEHAQALSLALRAEKRSQTHSKHLVFAMFSPGFNLREQYFDSKKASKFKIGFSGLERLENVQLFASDKELSVAYCKLLGESESLSIHPCYLINYVLSERIKMRKLERSHIVLYAGDAKVDKGFCELPNLLLKVRERYGNEIEILIQYTIDWEYPEIEQTVSKLKRMQKHIKQLRLIERFWSEEELYLALLQAKFLIINYDVRSYRQKSSGFVWLAHYLEVPMVIFNEGWPLREAVRLGSTVSRQLDFQPLGSAVHGASRYEQQIFAPFIEWARDQIIGE